MKNVDEIYNTLVSEEYFTENELQLITCINGYTEETLNNCIYARYGYRDLEQLMEVDNEISEDY